jgi:hypothetical protein
MTAKYSLYDNGGKTCDRYTMVYLDSKDQKTGMYDCFGMSDRPTHPQGVGQHSQCHVGRHLGKRIKLADLPGECQRVVERLTAN